MLMAGRHFSPDDATRRLRVSSRWQTGLAQGGSHPIVPGTGSRAERKTASEPSQAAGPPLMRWGRHGLAQFIVLAANQREGRILADVSEEFMRALVIGADMSVALASGAHAVA